MLGPVDGHLLVTDTHFSTAHNGLDPIDIGEKLRTPPSGESLDHCVNRGAVDVPPDAVLLGQVEMRVIHSVQVADHRRPDGRGQEQVRLPVRRPA